MILDIYIWFIVVTEDHCATVISTMIVVTFSYVGVNSKYLNLFCGLQFNARSESITEKASFRRLVPGSRCLVAVEGYGCYALIYLHFLIYTYLNIFSSLASMVCFSVCCGPI